MEEVYTAATTVRTSGRRTLMGVPWIVTLHAPTAEAGDEAVRAALDEVERIDAILSDYRPTTELSRLSAAAPTSRPMPVGEDLWEVLRQAVAIRDESDGAFDPTVGPLTTLWRQARKRGSLPPPRKLAEALAATGPDTLRLVPEARGVELLRPGMRLDLGGIGMGFAIDRVLALLRARGIDSALIDASGDVGASGPPPESPAWRIALDPIPGRLPAATGRVHLAWAAITTSGDARQAVSIGGRRYSHIVDPRTGLGVQGPAAVTVIAPQAASADALATAASVLGPVRGRTLLENRAGCAGRFVAVDGGGEGERESVREVLTSRWPDAALGTAPAG